MGGGSGERWKISIFSYLKASLIENDCIVTQVGVYDEISPDPSSCHNTVTNCTRKVVHTLHGNLEICWMGKEKAESDWNTKNEFG